MGKKRKAPTDAVVSIDGTESETSAPPAKRLQQRRQLFLHSLAATTTTESLIQHFSESFPVKHAAAVTDPTTKTCKGYGFITFADADDAKRALEDFNGSTLLGRKIKAEIAEPRHRDVDDSIAADIPGGDVERRKALAEEKRRKKEEERKEQLKPPKLIVRNLPWTIKDGQQLGKLFMSFGKVKHADVPKKKGSLSAGFGFVTLRGKKNAEKAIRDVNGKEVDGRTLAVDFAVEKAVWEKQVNGLGGDSLTVKAVDGAGEDDAGDGVPLSAEEQEKADVEAFMQNADLEDESDSVSDSEGSDADAASEDAEHDVIDGSPNGEPALDNEQDALASTSEEETPENDYTTTLFIRNLPFTTTDTMLLAHFRTFGPLRYARTVLDRATSQPKGTAFVSFVNPADALECLRSAPDSSRQRSAKEREGDAHTSVVQSELDDPTGRYTIDGRILSVTRAVSKEDSTKLASSNKLTREQKDRRRLYLLSEGTISASSPLWAKLSHTEQAMREASLKQRKSLIQKNPSLHLSLTRLSVRNIPRSVGSKALKALARDAVVGFATDVKQEKRSRLSREEVARGGEEMVAAEKHRKKKGKGLVKQAKVVFEGREGGKVEEASGAGRSRGYGFIEYYTHRAALMGLRWLNGHDVGYEILEKEGKGKGRKEEPREKRKRLIVEFAIENAQVVKRRRDREDKARSRSAGDANTTQIGDKDRMGLAGSGVGVLARQSLYEATPDSGLRKNGINKRKRGAAPATGGSGTAAAEKAPGPDEKQAKRQRIINSKRAKRRAHRK